MSVCTLADVPEAFDISCLVREAERLDEAMTSTTQELILKHVGNDVLK